MTRRNIQLPVELTRPLPANKSAREKATRQRFAMLFDHFGIIDEPPGPLGSLLLTTPLPRESSNATIDLPNYSLLQWKRLAHELAYSFVPGLRQGKQAGRPGVNWETVDIREFRPLAHMMYARPQRRMSEAISAWVKKSKPFRGASAETIYRQSRRLFNRVFDRALDFGYRGKNFGEAMLALEIARVATFQQHIEKQQRIIREAEEALKSASSSDSVGTAARWLQEDVRARATTSIALAREMIAELEEWRTHEQGQLALFVRADKSGAQFIR